MADAEDNKDLQMIIIEPDDFHHHLRDNEALPLLVPHCAAQFRRAIVMPNLKPPVVNAKQAAAYRERILKHVPKGLKFEPLMTLYLTDNTTPQDIIDAAATGFIFACKLYPAGATTNSDSGVTDIAAMQPVYEQMVKSNLLLLVHGEVTTGTHPNVDIFDREDVAIEAMMIPVISKNPNLKIVMEHITTETAVKFVRSCGPNVAATITAHHLLKNRNDIFRLGITSWLYCLPILKKESDRVALLEAATSGEEKFFAGTDSAPHEKNTKECCFGHAGIYTAHAAVSLYARAFHSVKKLNMLEGFLSKNGAKFYGLKQNEGKMEIKHKMWRVPESYPFRKVKTFSGSKCVSEVDGELRPFFAGDVLSFMTKRLEASI